MTLMKASVWTDPIRCVTYVGILEIRGLCLDGEVSLEDVVSALSSFFGLDEALVRLVFKRANARFGQLSLTLGELVQVIEEVGKRVSEEEKSGALEPGTEDPHLAVTNR